MNFYPNTFVLPEDSEKLLTFMTPEKLVLVKPPNWFSGLGIKLTNKLGDIRNMERYKLNGGLCKILQMMYL